MGGLRAIQMRTPIFAVLVALAGFSAQALAQDPGQSPGQSPDSGSGQNPPQDPSQMPPGMPPEPSPEPVPEPVPDPATAPTPQPSPATQPDHESGDRSSRRDNDRNTSAPDIPDAGYQSSSRDRTDHIPCITLDGLLAALKDGESLVISRHQDRIVIRKDGNIVSPYSDISDSLRLNR